MIGVQQGYPGIVATNVTVTRPTAGGYVTDFGTGENRPLTSVVNFSPGQTVPNASTVDVGTAGSVDYYDGSGGTADLIVDIFGYYN